MAREMRIRHAIGSFVLILLLLAACDTREQARTTPAVETSAEAPMTAEAPVLETEQGEASFYADILDRQRTASGEPLDQNELVAAHRRFPFGTILRVTNLENGRQVHVRVIDRGPFGAPTTGAERIIDLSRRAAEELGIVAAGQARVRVDVVEYGEGLEHSDASN